MPTPTEHSPSVKVLQPGAWKPVTWQTGEPIPAQLYTGDRLGIYEIVAPLGAGGMGKVYRALDTQLGRHVAIKVLPAALSRTLGRAARFHREAQVLAALNHPNIASIYGLEGGRDGRALVMELVEGPSLARKIQEGPVRMREALRIARQIAEALEYAHEKGVVHRDLKPANIMLTLDGTVKVLDFGLAMMTGSPLAGPDAASMATLTMGLTKAGMILGTVAYMAPEQARGKQVDKRADIWAFGVVFYEMLTGTRLFSGETVSDTLAAVLTREVPLELVPAAARNLLHRCLEKDPRQRLRDIGDARFLMEEIQVDPPQIARRWSWLPW